MKNRKNDKTNIISVIDEKSDKTVMLNNELDNIKNNEVIDNEKEIDSGFYKDPISFEKTIHETDFDLQKLFPGRTKSGHIKINRNFLKDAEPFSLERLNQEAKNISEGVFTGFNSLDLLGEITSYRPMLFYGLAKKEIVLILLNVLINMTKNYKNKHFLYYSYGEFRIDMEFKLINVLSETVFENKHNLNTNLKQWINEISSASIEDLIDSVKKRKEYSGLRDFLSISKRIHIIDGNYNFADLRDSMHSFSKVFDIGAVIIDNGEEINLEQHNNEGFPKIKYISDIIRKLSLELNLPFFYGYGAVNEIKSDVSSNVNYINYSTRVIKVIKEYPKIFLIDNDSDNESTLEVNYDLFKVKEI